MIKWLFFDIGSTLIDESECESFRLEALLNQPGAPGREEVLRSMVEIAALNGNPYKDTARKYGLNTTKWPGNLEKLYPNAARVLAALQPKFKLGIIANQNPGVEGRLETFGIRKCFDLVVSSAELGIAKPDPRIFQWALKKAECQPNEAIMIGDRLDNDIEPAGKLGMHTVWIRQGMGAYGNPGLISKVPDIVIEKIDQIPEIIANFS